MKLPREVAIRTHAVIVVFTDRQNIVKRNDFDLFRCDVKIAGYIEEKSGLFLAHNHLKKTKSQRQPTVMHFSGYGILSSALLIESDLLSVLKLLKMSTTVAVMMMPMRIVVQMFPNP